MAVFMVLFFLIGGMWILARLGDVIGRPDHDLVFAPLRKIHDEARSSERYAQTMMRERENELEQARAEYEFRREEYRVSVDEGFADPARERLYLDALRDFELAADELELATRVHEELAREAEADRAALNEAQSEVQRIYQQEIDRYHLRVFLLRFAYVLPVFLGSFLLWRHFREQGSRYLIIATSLIAFSSLQMIGLMGQYTLHLFQDISQLIISVVGTVTMIAGIVSVKRYLFGSQRLMQHRFRRGQCSSCGFPVDRSSQYCADCGSSLFRTCSTCNQMFPVGAVFCTACGQSSEDEE